MKRAHRGRDKCKVSFEILIKKVINIPKEFNASTVFLGWRRGTKKTSGATKRVLVNKNEAVWEEKIIFETKLFLDPKTQKIDEKKLSLSLKEDNPKKKKTKKFASASIDLGGYATNASDVVTIPLGKNSKTAPLLQVVFRIKPLKYNNKILVKVEPGYRKEKDMRLVKKIGGEDYFLDRTDSDLSNTTVETASTAASDDEDDHGSPFDEDDTEATSGGINASVANSELNKRIGDLQEQLEAIESESFERLTVIRDKDKEIASLQKKLSQVEKEVSEKDEQLEKQAEDKDELLAQLERLRKPAGRGEADALRAEAIERMATINGLEKEVQRLKKELKDKDKERESDKEKDRERERDRERDKERTRDRGRDNQNSEDKATILRLQQENERLTKLLKEAKESGSDGGRVPYKSRATSRGDDDEGERNGGLGGRLEISRQRTANASNGDDSKQIASLRQDLEEKILLEKGIHNVEPQLRAGIPISAGLIFDALVSWGALQPQDKSHGGGGSKALANVTAGIEAAIKHARFDNALLCYWLATITSLLSKLRHKQETEWNGPSSDALLDNVASTTMSPATRFELSLTAAIGKAYSTLVKNICNQLDPILVPVMLYHHHMPRGTTYASGANVVLQIIDELYTHLHDFNVHNALIAQLLSHLLYHVDAVLFNAVATRTELCTCTHGFRIRLQVSRVEEWVPTPFVSVREQLAPVVQAAKLLVMDKQLLAGDPDVFLQVSPKLTAMQIRHIMSNYRPDTLSPEEPPAGLSRTLDRLPPTLDHPQTHNNAETVEIDPGYVPRLSLSFINSSGK